MEMIRPARLAPGRHLKVWQVEILWTQHVAVHVLVGVRDAHLLRVEHHAQIAQLGLVALELAPGRLAAPLAP